MCGSATLFLMQMQNRSGSNAKAGIHWEDNRIEQRGGDSITHIPWFFTRLEPPFFMKWFKVIIADKNRMESIIMNCGLDWTILRCPDMVDKPAREGCRVALDGKGLKQSVTLPGVATFIVEQLTDLYLSNQVNRVRSWNDILFINRHKHKKTSESAVYGSPPMHMRTSRICCEYPGIKIGTLEADGTVVSSYI